MPPTGPGDAFEDETWARLLLANHWIDETTYEWVGPPSLAPVPTHKGKRKGKGAWPTDIWKLLRDHPSQFTNLKEMISEISLVASQVCSDQAGGWLKGQDSSERVRGTRKKHIMVYKKRAFCGKHEAGHVHAVMHPSIHPSKHRALCRCHPSPIHPCNHPPIHPVTHSLIQSIHTSTHPPILPSSHPSHPCRHSPIHPPSHPSIHTPMRPFIHSCIQSYSLG